MANITDIERLNYYEGEFLGAVDFQAEQEYHRDMRRRHNLGQHTWGIVAGLDIAQVPVPGSTSNAVDVYIQPGMAVDGFGREIVVLNKTQLTLDLFAAYPNPGVLNVWISYAAVPLNPPTDPCTAANQPNAFGRVQEAFALSFPLPDGTEPTNDLLVVDNTTMAVPAQPPTPPPPVPPPVPGVIVLPYDDSVPYQEFPADDSAAHWHVLLGQVSWDPTQIPPALVQIPDSQAATGRQYAGSVASAIFTPGNSLVIQDRFAPNPLPKDLSDPTLKEFYGGVGVEVVGSLTVDRLLEAKQNILIDGAADPANTNLSPLTINASSADKSFIQFRDSFGPLFSIWETAATPNPPSPPTTPAGLNFGETDNTGKPTRSDLFIQKGGNIGIGTQTPAVSLDVRGLASFQGVGIGTQTPVASLDVRGQATFQGALSINYAGVTGVGAPGDVRAAITFGATDTPSAFYFGTYDKNSTKANTILGVWSYQLSDWIQYWTPNGNVGIGTVVPQQKLSVNGGLNIDQANQNPGGTVAPGLTFGSGSGEGIASCRTPGGNLYGLDFYTNFTSRLSINNGGLVSTAGPLTVGSSLTVNGSRTYLSGQDGANIHWIMGGGTLEGINNALAFSFDNGTNQGTIGVASNWTFNGGAKIAYLADRFINRSTQKLERGDVVVLHAHAASPHYGSDERIPLPEVQRADKECDTGVCGIVDEPIANPSVIRDLDTAKLDRASVGTMVTVGAYAYCKADAASGAISPGDLLTTSSTPGHAQKAPATGTVTAGAIIGKALGSLKKGKGIIPILVSHQ